MQKTSPEGIFEKSPKLKEVTEKLTKVQKDLEKEKLPSLEKEKRIKEEIKSCLRELQKTPSFAPPPTTYDELKEIKDLEPSQQVGALINLVFEEGLEKAVSLARKINNPAILDEFHDVLVDHYYKFLVERKIIKP